jgi:hypothetical protein
VDFSTSVKKGGVQISSMEKYVFSAKEEATPSDQIAEPTYVWNLVALMIAIIFCLFSFQII